MSLKNQLNQTSSLVTFWNVFFLLPFTLDFISTSDQSWRRNLRSCLILLSALPCFFHHTPTTCDYSISWKASETPTATWQSTSGSTLSSTWADDDTFNGRPLIPNQERFMGVHLLSELPKADLHFRKVATLNIICHLFSYIFFAVLTLFIYLKDTKKSLLKGWKSSLCIWFLSSKVVVWSGLQRSWNDCFHSRWKKYLSLFSAVW